MKISTKNVLFSNVTVASIRGSISQHSNIIMFPQENKKLSCPQNSTRGYKRPFHFLVMVEGKVISKTFTCTTAFRTIRPNIRWNEPFFQIIVFNCKYFSEIIQEYLGSLCTFEIPFSRKPEDGSGLLSL